MLNELKRRSWVWVLEVGLFLVFKGKVLVVCRVGLCFVLFDSYLFNKKLGKILSRVLGFSGFIKMRSGFFLGDLSWLVKIR